MRVAVFCLILALLMPHASSQEGSPEARKTGKAWEAQFLTGIRQVTFEGLRAGEGYFSPDGTAMIFQSERSKDNPFYQIYLMDLETGDTERISPGIGKTTCSWIHPDGRRVLYASTHEDPQALVKMKEELRMRASGQKRRYAWDYDETYDLFVFDPDTGEQKNLTRTRGYDAEGSFSPDGRWIAFASNRAAYTEKLSDKDQQRFNVDKSLFMDIYIMKADGTEVRRLTRARGYDGGPFFSPDGKKICWRRFNEQGTLAEVFTMNIDGSNKRQLTHLNAMSWAPTFHPSGEYLIFSTNKHGFGNFELYLVDKDGDGEPIRVTFTDKFDGLPMFTPDGTKLAWTSQRTLNGKAQIFMANWNYAQALKMIKARRSQRPQQASASSRRTTTSRATSRPASRPVGMTDYRRIADVMNKLGVATTPKISQEDLRTHLEILAGPAMEGRFTGTLGEELAAVYVARRFQEMGLGPVGGIKADTNLELDAMGDTMVLVLRSEGLVQPFDFTSRPSPHSPEIKGHGNNVVAVLRAPGEGKRPAVVLGAHLDHLGRQGHGSRSAEGDKKKTHFGANDNASGVAALLEVADYLSDMKSRGKLKLKHDIIFCCFSAEELGAAGSRHFVNSLEKAGVKVAAFVNLDMVGRLRDNVTIQGAGSSSVWRREIERRNAPVGLHLVVDDAQKELTDTASFYSRNIPTLSLTTGLTEDYKRHTDTVDKINYDGLSQVARFTALLMRGLAISSESPDFIPEKKEKPDDRRSQEIALGTIPDYAEPDVPGLLLQGATPGGPAAKAGIKAGDIVVELAGQEVIDIQTFMAAFKFLKVGKPSKILVIRDGREVELTIVPGARQ